MKKTITSDFFTTLSKEQFFSSLKSLTFRLPYLSTWKDIEKANESLKNYIEADSSSSVFSYYNWRTAIYRTLKTLWVWAWDEVVVCSYNCISVVNTIIQLWATPIYVDIDDELWIDLDDLKQKISNKTKVVIFQHTFWIVSNSFCDAVAFCKEKNILTIEDCAHSLWSKIDWKHLWNFWDFAIFSTWRDKVISSVTWWFLLVNNKSYIEKFEKDYLKLTSPDTELIIKNHLYNIFFFVAIKTYDFLGLWKVIIYLVRQFNLITPILTTSEKNCMYSDFCYKLPNSLAYLFLRQLENIDLVKSTRKSNFDLYSEKIHNLKNFKLLKISWEFNCFRIILISENENTKNELVDFMRKNRIFLWTSWSWTNICPVWSNLEFAKYTPWSCPKAEKIGKTSVSLPNHTRLNKNDIDRVINLIIDFDNSIS